MQKFIDNYFQRDGKIFNKNRPDKPIGYFCKSAGYMRFKCFNKTWLLHRGIFLLGHGYLPKYIDHINRNKLDNRLENLRECSKTQNCVNSLVRSDNPYGLKGVTFHKSSGKYAAQSFYNGKRVHIGLFNTPEEAGIAYNNTARELFGEFAVLNEVQKELEDNA